MQSSYDLGDVVLVSDVQISTTAQRRMTQADVAAQLTKVMSGTATATTPRDTLPTSASLDTPTDVAQKDFTLDLGESEAEGENMSS